MKLKSAIRLMRPGHWVKNVLVLLPVVFAQRMDDWRAWLAAGVAAAAFCLASSAAYVFNDICDRKRDRQHPSKKDRPVAAGAVGVPGALLLALLLLAGAAGVALFLSKLVLAVVLAYVLLQLAYTFYLQKFMLVDVICIALGFVLRAAAGAVAIAVVISPWLFVCMFTICLFMGFCKRRTEIVTMGGVDEAKEHRPTLIGYSPELLTHLITLSAAVAIVAFLLHASNPRTVKSLGTDYLIYTLPLVTYAVFRFAMLSMSGSYADPVDLVLHDRPFQLTVAMWVAAVLAVVLVGTQLRDWLAAHY